MSAARLRVLHRVRTARARETATRHLLVIKSLLGKLRALAFGFPDNRRGFRRGKVWRVSRSLHGSFGFFSGSSPAPAFQLPRQPSPRVRTPGDARARTVSGYHDYHPYDVLVKANGFVRRSRSVVPRETGGRVRRNETSRYTCKISRNNDDVWMGACRDVRDLN